MMWERSLSRPGEYPDLLYLGPLRWCSDLTSPYSAIDYWSPPLQSRLTTLSHISATASSGDSNALRVFDDELAYLSLLISPSELEVMLEGDRANEYSIGLRLCGGLVVALVT